jgi:hypothetical protein
VSFNDVPPEAFVEAMSTYGMPRWQVDGLLEYYEHYRRGEAATVSSVVRDVTGNAPCDINAFAHDYVPAFAGASG